MHPLGELDAVEDQIAGSSPRSKTEPPPQKLQFPEAPSRTQPAPAAPAQEPTSYRAEPPAAVASPEKESGVELDQRTVEVLTERYHCYKAESEMTEGLDLESLAKFLIEGFAFRRGLIF